jgi:hypothetical protein
MQEKQEVRLTSWSEVVGTFHRVFADNHFTYVKINDKTLSFPKESQESEIIQTKLKSLIGRRIGILKTDLIDWPLRIRLIDSEDGTH